MGTSDAAKPTPRLIRLDGAKPPQERSPVDLHQLRVDEFLQAKSLSVNSQRAYRRELQRFIDWSDRPVSVQR